MIKRLNLFSLSILIGLSCFLYWNTRSAGFVMDWFGWEYKYLSGGWSDVPKSFGYKGLHPVLHFFNYAMYAAFQKSDLAWFLVFATLHGVNAWLSGCLYLRLASQNNQMLGALGVSLLVLLSPYAAEPVVWRVCLHYLMVLFFALSGMHVTLDYLETRRLNCIIWVHLFFLLGIFSLEWALVMPGLFGLLLVRHELKMRKFSWQNWVLLPGIQAVLIGAWFLLNKLILGSYVGHYGASTHLKFEPLSALATAWNYFFKHAFFMRYWHHQIKERVFEGMHNPVVTLGFCVLLLGLIIVAAYQWRKQRGTVSLDFCIALLCFFMALLPVCNLFFYYIDYNENDRYGYFANPFLWIAAVMLITQLPRKWAYFVLIFLIMVSVYCLTKTTRLWHEANIQFRSLVQDFHQYDTNEALILALPDNYQGVYMFRMIGGESGFKEALELYTGKPYTGKMSEAVMYNAQTLDDAIKAEVDSTKMNYKISFVHNGSWWFWNGIGASDRETDGFIFTKKEWHAEVQLKSKAPRSVVLYPVKGKWQTLE